MMSTKGFPNVDPYGHETICGRPKTTQARISERILASNQLEDDQLSHWFEETVEGEGVDFPQTKGRSTCPLRSSDQSFTVLHVALFMFVFCVLLCSVHFGGCKQTTARVPPCEGLDKKVLRIFASDRVDFTR